MPVAAVKTPQIMGDVVLSNGDLAVLAGNEVTAGSTYGGFDQLQVAILSNSTPFTLNQSSGNLTFAANGDPDGRGPYNGSLYAGGAIAAIPGGGMAILTYGAADLSYDLQVLTNSLTTTRGEFTVAHEYTTTGNNNAFSANPIGSVAAWSGGLVVAWSTDGQSNLFYQRFTTAGVASGGVVTVESGANTNWNGSLAVDSLGDVVIGTDAVNANGKNDTDSTYYFFNGSNTEHTGTVANTNGNGFGAEFVPLSGGGFLAVGYTPVNAPSSTGNYTQFVMNVQEVSTSGSISTLNAATTVNVASTGTIGINWISQTASAGLVDFAEFNNTSNYDTYNVGTGTLTRNAGNQPSNPGYDLPLGAPGPNNSGSGVAGLAVNGSNQLVAEGLAPPPPAVTEALVSDTGSSLSDHITSNDALTGGGDANAVVTLTAGASTLGTATANGSGTWTFTPTLADGTHTIVASETNSGGTGSATVTFTLDTTPPAVTESLVSDTGSSSSDHITSDDALTGGGDANAVVTLKEGVSTLGTTTANGSGTWTFTPSPSVSQGSNTIVASETDTAGNTGSATVAFTLDTVAPAVTEALVSDTGLSSSDKITSNDALTGGGDANAVVTLKEGVSTLGTTTANGSGTWTFTPSLSDGAHTIVASETDTAGNTGSATVTFTLDTTAPAVTEALVSDTGSSSSDHITSNDALTGGGDANAVVTLKEGVSTLGTTTANGSGTWTFTPSVANGSNTIVASETDAAGNTGSATVTFTLDTVAPAVTEALVSDTGSSSSDKITSNDALTGGGDANAVVTLKEGVSTLGTTTANGSGTWTFTPSLSDGAHTIVASETDAAGNTGSATVTFTLDTTAPAVTEALVSDTGSSSSDHITSNDALTGGGDANAVVTLTEGVSTLGTATANGSGTWTFTPSVANGSNTIVASETDAAGNTGSATVTFTLDTVAPAVSSIDTVGASSNSGGTEQFTVAFSEPVTGVDMSDFTLADTGSVAGTISSINGSGGSYTVTVTGATGSGTMGLDLKSSGTGITDVAGNAISGGFTSGETYTITPASTTFDAHVYTDVNGDGVQDTGDTNLVGVTVNLLDGSGNPTGQSMTTDSGGNVSFTGLAPGSYEIGVVPPAGDVVSQATNTFTPNTLSGGQTANATEGVYVPATFDVHVYDDVNANGTQDGGDGNLSGVTVNLLDGSGNPTGKSSTTDANGNASFSGLAPGSYEVQVVPPSGDAVTQASNTQTPNVLSSGGSASATEGVYAPPALEQATLDLTVAEGVSLGNIWSELIANGVDPNPSSLKITAVGTSGTQGFVALNTGAQSLTYLATGLNPAAPVDAFTYTLTDGSGGTVTGTVDVTVTGPNLPTTVATTPGSTTTATGAGQVLISEGAGETLVGSSAGGDELFGGANTTISAGGSGNQIFEGPGNHSVFMGANNNTVTLANGNNTISGTGTDNTITGGTGNATITGLTGSATITLGDGNDTITISGANNTISVGTGTDHINAGSGGNESVTAANGANSITVGGAGDVVHVGNGNNTIVATGASATITTGNGNNTILASGAGDSITTGSGNDSIQVTAGAAMIRAGLGTDTMKFAGSGSTIINQGGTDTLTDTGTKNTIALPLAGQGLDTTNGSVLANGDTFDLRFALAATTWDQQGSDLGNYLSLGTSGSNALVEISVTSGGTPITVAILDGEGAVSLASFVAHALLT